MADEFKVHRLNEEGLRGADSLGEIFTEALDEIKSLLKNVPSRELALVITKLQEASFWAKRALAMQPGNQEDYKPHRWVLEGENNYCTACGCENGTPEGKENCPKYVADGEAS